MDSLPLFATALTMTDLILKGSRLPFIGPGCQNIVVTRLEILWSLVTIGAAGTRNEIFFGSRHLICLDLPCLEISATESYA